MHAHEEDTDGEMVFRPAGTPLPPSRGRMAFDLRPDGTFAESGLGATDVPEEATGTWTLDGETLTLSEGAAQGVPREMQVVSLDDDRLILKRREGG
ncbi:MAG: hypothetical protein JWN97_1839 [Nocardioides sp.]|nr:hypothetical protein [Nocardioides sp.]